MSYAGHELVLSRAGILADRWTEDSTPGIGDLDGYCAQESAKIDAAIAGRGYDVPLTDETQVGAVSALTADLALLIAIANSFPGATLPGSVQLIYNETRERARDGVKALRDGTHDVFKILDQTSPQATGATSFWQEEAQYGLVPRSMADLNPYTAPAVGRGDVF